MALLTVKMNPLLLTYLNVPLLSFLSFPIQDSFLRREPWYAVRLEMGHICCDCFVVGMDVFLDLSDFGKCNIGGNALLTGLMVVGMEGTNFLLECGTGAHLDGRN
jgi:hypothetical protein